jgi:hypothetical protein
MVTVLDQRRSLENEAGNLGPFEFAVRSDKHRIRVDLRLDQTGEAFNNDSKVSNVRLGKCRTGNGR